LGQSGKVMPLVRIDLHFIWDFVLLQNPFEPFRFRNWNHRIPTAMKDQDRRKFSGILNEILGKACKKFCHCGDSRFLSGQREREKAAERKAKQSDAPLIDPRLRDDVTE